MVASVSIGPNLRHQTRTVPWLMSIPRLCSRSSTLQSDRGHPTQSITARRMISGLVVKHRTVSAGSSHEARRHSRPAQGVCSDSARGAFGPRGDLMWGPAGLKPTSSDTAGPSPLRHATKDLIRYLPIQSRNQDTSYSRTTEKAFGKRGMPGKWTFCGSN